MLKSLTTSASTASPSTTSVANEPRDEVVDRLQQQLNSLKLKVFKLSQVPFGKTQGLIDSGATHALRPLRPGESCANYKTVNVTLANGQQAQLRMTPGGVMVSGCADVEPPYLLPPPEKKEGEEELKPGGFDIKIFRLAAPMITKTAREVTKTAMDFIPKLRMDGFHIGRILSGRGHEFSGVFRKWANSRGIVLTRTPGDDPRANGRVEVPRASKSP